LYERQSPYNTIFVTEDQAGLRTLWFERGGARQSVVKVGDPDHIELPYARVMPVGLLLVDRPRRALIVGLGGGTIPSFLHKHFPELKIDVVDIDPEAVELAEALFAAPGVSFAVADVTRMETLGEAMFDVVVALEVLEHLPRESIPAFMAAVRRILVPAGTFVVSVANRAHREREENPLHLSEMTFQEFKGLLATWSPSSSLELFGQDVWAGTWRLDRECRIEGIRSATSHHVYLGVAAPEGSRTKGATLDDHTGGKTT
jgi:spermidine synthase